ncbi:hypothetical protein KSP40_PGU011459 [Platanthera guangdongensis]|uniref:Uncharacterized protein n=1 Tax=Platanthera guangdongensis TaxID=2320717 RepID=A0ABR2MMD3_9ASPA
MKDESASMKGILVDWLVEVTEDCALCVAFSMMLHSLCQSSRLFKIECLSVISMCFSVSCALCVR